MMAGCMNIAQHMVSKPLNDNIFSLREKSPTNVPFIFYKYAIPDGMRSCLLLCNEFHYTSDIYDVNFTLRAFFGIYTNPNVKHFNSLQV